jgi:primase-polymerase (primpol)-like protein
MRNSRRWVRADRKRPIRPDSRPASSTNPTTWSDFSEVHTGAGDGFGVMLGSGLGCYDLDHVGDSTARAFIATIPERILFVERSMSGTGVHVFVEAPEGPGRRLPGVERYTRARFIRVTGNLI